MTFRTVMTVRLGDLDTNGHVRGPAYLEFADQARWECLEAAGIDLDEVARRRIGPVNLETTIRFHQELRPKDEFSISCVFSWGDGKTSRVDQELRKADGTLVAEVSSVSGLLDLEERRLLPDPASHWRELAADPELLGIKD